MFQTRRTVTLEGLEPGINSNIEAAENRGKRGVTCASGAP